MRYLIPFALLSLILTSCYSAETTSTYNSSFTWGRSNSKPIYLMFKKKGELPFYFMLNRDSKEVDYKLIVRWKSPRKGDLLFNGSKTTLKFLVDNEKIYSYQPATRPRVVAYNMNSKGHEEEAIFSINREEFMKIAYAKSVSVELLGRNNTSIGYFSRRNTLKAFREFAENSH